MVHWCKHKSALRSVGKPQGSVDVIEEFLYVGELMGDHGRTEVMS